jgi:GR25 family glycosyltransferase involved in LPS biosynthesis
MPCPKSWDELLQGNVYIINLDRQPERYALSRQRAVDAGFKNVNRWRATDCMEDDIPAAWATHGSPEFDPSDKKFVDFAHHPHKQGIFLSHFSLLKHIVDNNIPFATVYEDDIAFHKDWSQLAPAYFAGTPPDYGLCYIGHHCGCGVDANIVRVPVYCTQSYIVTYEGAKLIYNKIKNDRSGVRTIDCQLNYYMCMWLRDNTYDFCNWYAWNGEMFPDETVVKHPDHVQKDLGLVFQDYQSYNTVNDSWALENSNFIV